MNDTTKIILSKSLYDLVNEANEYRMEVNRQKKILKDIELGLEKKFNEAQDVIESLGYGGCGGNFVFEYMGEKVEVVNFNEKTIFGGRR